MNEQKIKNMVKMYRKGEDIKVIAKKHKTSVATIFNMMTRLRKLGVKIERPRFRKSRRLKVDWNTLATSLIQ